MRRLAIEIKVGLFALIILIVMVWSTIRVSDRSQISGRGYEVSIELASATGLKMKAPVELAGVAVGVVKRVELSDSRIAKVVLLLNREVKLPEDSQAILRTRGFLGETYVELVPGTSGLPLIKDGGLLANSTQTGDINQLVGKMTEIADDVKAVTSNLRTLVGDNQEAPVNKIIANLEKFTEAIKDVTLRNTDNIDRIAVNMAELTGQLKEIIAEGRQDINASMERIASITGKIDRGEGTVGKLINDDETVTKLNDSLDGLNDTVGSLQQLELEVGVHTEFLTNSKDFKNYVSLGLRPTPDKAVLLDLISDPDPSPTHVRRTTDVTVGGTTTTVTTDTSTIDRNKLRISAQLAKKFYDVTVRGGLIESTGGMGLDYDKGPFGIRFSAFDFSTRFGQRPHLKLLGDVSLTKNFFVVGGADDMLNPAQSTDYFVGGGFRFVDDDLKKLARFGGGSSLFGK